MLRGVRVIDRDEINEEVNFSVMYDLDASTGMLSWSRTGHLIHSVRDTRTIQFRVMVMVSYLRVNGVFR